MTSQLSPAVWNPCVTHDALAERSSARRAQLGWQFLAVVTAVAFSALAIFAVVMIGPTADSLIGFVVILLSGYQAVKMIWEKATENGKTIKLNDCFIAKLNKLPTEAIALRQTAEALGVKTEKLSDQDLLKVRPAVAQAQHYIERSENKLKKYAAEDEKEKVDIESFDFSKSVLRKAYNSIVLRELKKYNNTLLSLIDRVHAAYLLSIIQNPRSTKPEEEFYKEYLCSGIVRRVAYGANFPNWDHYITVKHSNEKLSATEVQNLSVQKIAEKVFELNK